jgi:hypothetical protein
MALRGFVGLGKRQPYVSTCEDLLKGDASQWLVFEQGAYMRGLSFDCSHL